MSSKAKNSKKNDSMESTKSESDPNMNPDSSLSNIWAAKANDMTTHSLGKAFALILDDTISNQQEAWKT